ncbi:hypothetical protein M8C21_020036 [Ambrosia artemisiifolia]|uniref:Uncharacterized protein n=1 Tax=Ambrosia artemisiifolia TaxID=4212 RepID=A0AAD5GU69_AMBAR|nr:hypothetical protein M8C21_020036 [Ambrosia artemisiifolia]
MAPLILETLPDWKSGSSVEIDGVIKIQPMAEVDEKLLKSLGWKKSDFTEEGDLDLEDITVSSI